MYREQNIRPKVFFGSREKDVYVATASHALISVRVSSDEYQFPRKKATQTANNSLLPESLSKPTSSRAIMDVISREAKVC